MKHGPLDVAVCPSCAAVITRQKMHDIFKADRSAIVVCECGYEYNAPPYRPLTIAEMLRGRESEGEYRDVKLEAYTRKIFEIMKEAQNG